MSKPRDRSALATATGALAGNGFTLMELLVVLAIVGILAAAAIPSYMSSVARGHRADAKAALLEDAQFLERVFTECNRYDKAPNPDEADACTADTALPITVAPRDGTASYNVSASTLTESSYTLSAAPVTDGPMDGDDCGTLTLNNFGQRGASGALTVALCWDR